MAVSYLTLYLPDGTPVQVVEGGPLHKLYVARGADGAPPTPGPVVRLDPFPQYVDQDELTQALGGVGSSDTAVAALVNDTGSQTRGALGSALVPRPAGGTDGQALIKTGTNIAWGDAGQMLLQDPADDEGVFVAAANDSGDLITAIPGDSAYDMWIDAGNTGTPTDFLNSLKGTPGAAGTEYTPAATATWSGTVDLSAYTAPACLEVTLTGNVSSITLPSPPSDKSYPIMLVLIQDATGGRTVTWPTAPSSAGGIDPVLSTAAGAVDLVHLLWTGARWILVAGAMTLA